MAKLETRAFFDANILIESLLFRKNAAIVDSLLHQYAGRSYISAITGHIVTHYGQRYYDLVTLEAFLSEFEILPLLSGDFTWAFENAVARDFEDALQVSVALRARIPLFITFDQKLVSRYQQFDNLNVQ